MRRAIVVATAVPSSLRTRYRQASIPAAVPALVTTRPSSTKRTDGSTSADGWRRCMASAYIQWVVAGRPSNVADVMFIGAAIAIGALLGAIVYNVGSVPLTLSTSGGALIAGLFFGLSFGMGGLGAAALGYLADMTSIETVYKVCSFLPAIGLLAYFLPKIEKARA